MPPAHQTAASAAPEAREPVGAVALSHGELHAWLVDLDAPGSADMATLDGAEQARAASYLRPQDGHRFAASRAALRLILARYLGCEAGRVEFEVGPCGRPRLAREEVRFSLARSGGLALVAVSFGQVGADLEQLQSRSGLADLAAARFTAPEIACIAAGCGGSPMHGFYRHWTAKEAFLKAAGVGLSRLRDTELVCGPRLTIKFADRPAAGWSLALSTAIAPGYLAAIASPGRVTSRRALSPCQPGTRARRAGSAR